MGSNQSWSKKNKDYTRDKSTSSESFYAVRKGRTAGVYTEWAKCQEQVSGFSGAEFRKFDNMEQAQRFMQYLPVEEKKKKTNPPPILITKPSVLTTQPQQPNSTPTTNSGNQPDERGFGKKRKSNRAPLIESSKRFSSGESSDLRIKKEESDVRDHYYQNPRNDFGRKRYYDYFDRDSTSANANRDDSRRVRDDRRSRHRDRSPEPYRRDSRNSDSYARKSQVPSVFDDIVLKPEKNSEEFVSSTTLSQSTAINATIPSSTILQPGRKTNATDKGGTKGGTNKIFSVYTDGACSGNGKGGSQAGLGVFFGDGDPRNLSERLQGPQTNNRAELMAIIRALEVIAHEKKNGNIRETYKRIVVYTDSMYAINCVTKWIFKWSINNWKTSSQNEVLNRDLIERLFKLIGKAGKIVEFKHVLGHSAIHGNEMADRLAVNGSKLPEATA